eukprot:scaffold1006_cov408-Prasinococcus_capsulatus_cf.AAC.24
MTPFPMPAGQGKLTSDTVRKARRTRLRHCSPQPTQANVERLHHLRHLTPMCFLDSSSCVAQEVERIRGSSLQYIRATAQPAVGSGAGLGGEREVASAYIPEVYAVISGAAIDHFVANESTACVAPGSPGIVRVGSFWNARLHRCSVDGKGLLF